MVYSSPDCISFIQIICPEGINNDNEPMKIFITQRSLDIKKHGTNDLAFFDDWIQNSKFLPQKYKNRYDIDYTVTIPHEFIRR